MGRCGPVPGLMLLEQLASDESLEQYLPYHATRAGLLRKAGYREQAHSAYTRALALSENAVERKFFGDQLKSLEDEM